MSGMAYIVRHRDELEPRPAGLLVQLDFTLNRLWDDHFTLNPLSAPSSCAAIPGKGARLGCCSQVHLAVLPQVRKAWQLSERRVCVSLGVNRKMLHYRAVKMDDPILRARSKEIAANRILYGDNRIASS